MSSLRNRIDPETGQWITQELEIKSFLSPYPKIKVRADLKTIDDLEHLYSAYDDLTHAIQSWLNTPSHTTRVSLTFKLFSVGNKLRNLAHRLNNDSVIFEKVHTEKD